MISNKINGGYGQGNNIGIRKASGSVILIMNPDVRLVQPIFAKALAHFEKTKVVMLGMIQMVSPDKEDCRLSQNLVNIRFGRYWKQLLVTSSCVTTTEGCFSGACFLSEKVHLKKLDFLMKKFLCMGKKMIFIIAY